MFDPKPFFAFATERHNIYLRRQAGVHRLKWTEDNILFYGKFTNVFRELDRTTVWCKQYVRDVPPVDDMLLRLVAFRWFNRIKTGEAIFLQQNLSGKTAWEEFAESEYQDKSILRRAIVAYCGNGPYVTGAYIVKTPEGYDKLDGVIHVIKCFAQKPPDRPGWREVTAQLMEPNHSGLGMYDVWKWLQPYQSMGPFMGYEIVCDLRWTPLLDNARDRNTWSNPGPGAMRGLNRLADRELYKTSNKPQFLKEMIWLLEQSRDPDLWPHTDWPWELREVEHTLCEFDKYERVRLGEGNLKNQYMPYGA